jgi:hypothetical protein
MHFGNAVEIADTARRGSLNASRRPAASCYVGSGQGPGKVVTLPGWSDA